MASGFLAEAITDQQLLPWGGLWPRYLGIFFSFVQASPNEPGCEEGRRQATVGKEQWPAQGTRQTQSRARGVSQGGPGTGCKVSQKGEPTEMGQKEKDGRKVNPGRQIMIVCSVTLKAGVLPSAPWLWSVSVSHPETQ